ncbi:glutathione-dependent formaldehyde-activating enzyme domain-containing protein [Sarocladium implicatum]|nr:glutathione-dependent formaldehyde-activating enzyme domain-containing protein [Sarocladium implicatum]
MATKNPIVSCQCGAVSFPTSAPEPLGIFVCHCLECRKQSASAFGVTYRFPSAGMWPPESRQVRNNLAMWERSTDSGNTTECWFCKICGVRVIHRTKTPDGQYKETISVKGGCLEGFGGLERARHIFTRTAVVDVPEDSDPEPKMNTR